MRASFVVVLAFAASTVPLAGQLQIRPLAPALRPYTTCRIEGGPDLVEITPLIARNSVRPVQTLHGDRKVQLVDGARLMFSYPDTDFFANVKVEELPASSYSQGKADLQSNFDKLLSADDLAARNYALKPLLQGFDISGMDRKELGGNVLGIYLFFDNRSHVATTVYFLNADAAKRKFSTKEEYAAYRDQFLAKYMACVRAKINASATAAVNH